MRKVPNIDKSGTFGRVKNVRENNKLKHKATKLKSKFSRSVPISPRNWLAIMASFVHGHCCCPVCWLPVEQFGDAADVVLMLVGVVVVVVLPCKKEVEALHWPSSKRCVSESRCSRCPFYLGDFM